MIRKEFCSAAAVILACAFAAAYCVEIAGAHCDSLDGPVIKEAQSALEKGNVTPVLKWVKKDDENAVREAFAKTSAVRKKGIEAKELADMYFFETLVRIHRAGEGAPYTGLKPSGAFIEPAVAQADQALETGRPEALIKSINEEVSNGIQRRFQDALEKKKRSNETIDTGRDFVKSYVEFIHYAERLYLDAKGGAAAHFGKEEMEEGEHKH